MRIALATSDNVPDWERDDRPLVAALRELDTQPTWVAWDDPSVDWSAFDAVLIRTTWDYMERLEEYVAWTERIGVVTTLFNPPRIVRWNTHKSYLRDLERRGVAVVETVWCARGSTLDLSATRHAREWEGVFVKPAVGATSRATFRVVDETQLPTAQQHLDGLVAVEDVMVQPYLPSVETAGELSAIYIDGRFSHAVRKIPVRGDYRVQDDFGASDEPATLTRAELELADAVMACVDEPLLYGRADFLCDASGDLLLTELELVEPSMFFRHDPPAARRLAEALCARLPRNP